MATSELEWQDAREQDANIQEATCLMPTSIYVFTMEIVMEYSWYYGDKNQGQIAMAITIRYGPLLWNVKGYKPQEMADERPWFHYISFSFSGLQWSPVAPVVSSGLQLSPVVHVSGGMMVPRSA